MSEMHTEPGAAIEGFVANLLVNADNSTVLSYFTKKPRERDAQVCIQQGFILQVFVLWYL